MCVTGLLPAYNHACMCGACAFYISGQQRNDQLKISWYIGMLALATSTYGARETDDSDAGAYFGSITYPCVAAEHRPCKVYHGKSFRQLH
jgi:hypothetical protein